MTNAIIVAIVIAMTYRFITPVLLCFLMFGCTGQQLFSSSLSDKPTRWNVVSHPNSEQPHSCVVSSGVFGVRVIHTDTEALVETTRPVFPGSFVTITVGQQRFRSYDTQFDETASKQIIAAMLHASDLYIEWSELQNGRGTRQSWSNILSLKQFPASYYRCTK